MVVDVKPGIPAHIALLLNEDFPLSDPKKTARRLRAMSRDLRDQATIEPHDAYSQLQKLDDPSHFRIILSGGLDLLRGSGACLAPTCRLNYADQVARSVALMGDDVLLHDFFPMQLEDTKSASNEEILRLLSDLYVLRKLKPLVKAGIVRFSPSKVPSCQGCMDTFESRVEEISQRLLPQFRSEMSVERSDSGELTVDTGPMFNPSVVIRVGAKARVSDEEAMSDVFRDCIRSSLWDARDAAFYGGAIFSNSAIGMSGLMAAENSFESREALRRIEGQQASRLPWVSGLTIEQTLVLREEASQALPRLREFLARNLAAKTEASSAGSGVSNDYVAELREQAAEVKSELEAIRSSRKSFHRNSIGLLSLGVATLSVATGNMAPALGAAQLLTTLGLLHGLTGKDDDHTHSLKSKPGYVLVAAEQILGHAR